MSELPKKLNWCFEEDFEAISIRDEATDSELCRIVCEEEETDEINGEHANEIVRRWNLHEEMAALLISFDAKWADAMPDTIPHEDHQSGMVRMWWQVRQFLVKLQGDAK